MKLIKDWLANNKLILNISKTHAIHFTKNKKGSDIYKSLSIECGSQKISFVTETKALGVIIDNKLNFSAHIDKICKKVNSKSFLIARSIHLFTNKIRPTLFKLLIQPNFDYCCTLFIKTSKANRDRLEKCFNKSIHRILKINISTLIPENQIPENQFYLFFTDKYYTFLLFYIK